MKYIIERTSDSSKKPCKNAEATWTIEIDTLEELRALIEEVGCEVIVGKETIEIYDSYRE